MSLESTAEDLALRLAEHAKRVVFAESCTGGLVSATLAEIPGISQWLCGSSVVYREATKRDWLAIAESDIARFTAVSEPVARTMATSVLERTPEADLSASVTGHLGPQAPEGFDGLVFVAVASRIDQRVEVLQVRSHRLRTLTRRQRQTEAAELVLNHLIELLSEPGTCTGQ